MELEQRVAQWNDRCGRQLPQTEEEVFLAVEIQARIILEEVKEMLEGAEKKNEIEMLDGVIDTLFTVARLPSLLGHIYNLKEGCKRVCDNNDLKYSTDRKKVELWTTKKPSKVEQNGPYFYRVDLSGKICKPIDHPQVDLTGLKYEH